MQAPPLRLAILVSGSGTTLQNFIDEISAGRLDARIELVIGSAQNLRGVDRATAAKIPSHVVDRSQFPSVLVFSEAVFRHIDAAEVDLVLLAGWLKLLDVPPRYAGRVMNIHPALLPEFGGKGMYGLRVHQAVLDSGSRVSGCTVHFVDAGYDTGPIILQRVCPVQADDTPVALAARVFEQEKIAYPEAVRLWQDGRLSIDGRRVHIRTPASR